MGLRHSIRSEPIFRFSEWRDARPAGEPRSAAYLNRNFRFASPISSPDLDQPASLGKVLAQFGPVLVHGAASRAAMSRVSVSWRRNPRKCRLSNRFGRHFSFPTSRHQNPLRSAGRLSGWHRQRHNPAQHAAKQPPSQMTLRQEEPIVAGVFNQTAPGFHQPLLQAGERPLRHLRFEAIDFAEHLGCNRSIAADSVRRATL
jgi:hypothetical protein